jgi:hypothetical protein
MDEAAVALCLLVGNHASGYDQPVIAACIPRFEFLLYHVGKSSAEAFSQGPGVEK